MSSNKKKQLEELTNKMLACQKCVLRRTCSQVVPGAGPFDAEIMFIGEGPGKEEDKQGIPFVGAAGKFLNEMLEIISLKREDVYIANVVKCRPPENRDPLPEEAEACWSWLVEQIKTINPKIIVTLGRHSMERFLPGQKISQSHGKVMRRNMDNLGIRTFYTLYHPAAALYNGGMREVLKKDFRRIPKVLEAVEKNSEEKSESSSVEPADDKQEALF